MTASDAERLWRASVLIVGVGALGCAAGEALAEAGVGRLGLADPDRVEPSNLHRQLLHRTADLGRAKVASAAEKLASRRRDLVLEPIEARLDVANAERLLASYDCVVDATDGIASKFSINDAAVGCGRPLVHAGILGFHGQLFTVLPGRSACLRCLFPTPPPASDVPSCQEAGVLGSLAGTIGLLQAAEAVRYLCGMPGLLADRLLTYDALAGRWRQVRVRRDPRCPACGSGLTAAARA